jgi:hypothetical protein
VDPPQFHCFLHAGLDLGAGHQVEDLGIRERVLGSSEKVTGRFKGGQQAGLRGNPGGAVVEELPLFRHASTINPATDTIHPGTGSVDNPEPVTHSTSIRSHEKHPLGCRVAIETCRLAP